MIMENILLRELGITPAMLKSRGLRLCDEADTLQLTEIGENGREHHLHPEAATAWQQLKRAAAVCGESLFIVSAFRSIPRQADIIRNKLKAGFGIKEIITVCAPPGYSEHHTGLAVDISTSGVPPLNTVFENTTAFAWLNNYANEFGFILSYPEGNIEGYQYEPWHWCYVAAQQQLPADRQGRAHSVRCQGIGS